MYDEYDDCVWHDEYVDPNFSMPREFITAFQEHRRPIYEEAIKRATVFNAEWGAMFEIDDSHQYVENPALMYYGDGTLTLFWDMFYAAEQDLRGVHDV